MNTADMISEYLKNAEARYKRNHFQNEQMAQSIIKHMNEGERPTPAIKTSAEKLAQLEQDIARGFAMR